MNRSPVPCVQCTRFHRKPEAPPAHSYCEGYERFRRHDDTNEACPLFKQAKDEVQRRAWAEQQQQTISRASAAIPAVAGTTT